MSDLTKSIIGIVAGYIVLAGGIIGWLCWRRRDELRR